MTDWSPKANHIRTPNPRTLCSGLILQRPRGVRGEGARGEGRPRTHEQGGPRGAQVPSWHGGDVGAHGWGRGKHQTLDIMRRRRKQQKVEGMSWYGMITLMERSRVSGWQPCHAVCLMADGCVSPAVCRFPLMMVACHTTTTATATALRCALRVRVACIIRTCILHAYFWSKIHLRPTGHIIFMLSLFWHC